MRLSLQREIGQTIVEDEMLTLRSGVAAGTTYLVHLLPHSANSRVILTGPGVQEVWRCAELAESGETLVSSNAWTHVADHAKGRLMASGPMQLLDIGTPPQLGRRRSRQIGRKVPILQATYPSSCARDSRRRCRDGLRSCARSQRALLELPAPTSSITSRSSNRHTSVLESKITRFHGDLLRITACEGGLQGLAVFGLPGNAHKDDPRRAILAALELQSDVTRLGLNVSVGAATGDAFCGAIGTDRRAEYTVLGESVNRAARLCTLAAGRTLTDEPTAQESSSFVSFQGPWSMQVPGIRAPISTFVALRAKRDSVLTQRDVLIGRTEELARLNSLD